MFSATGKILTGTDRRPDLYYLVVKRGDKTITKYNQPHWLNQLGYIPVIGSVTGCGRLLLGVIHTIVHLASIRFDPKNKDAHREEVAIGIRNIKRGAAEMFPFLGGFLALMDTARLAKISKKMDTHAAYFKDKALLFDNAGIAAYMDLAEFETACESRKGVFESMNLFAEMEIMEKPFHRNGMDILKERIPKDRAKIIKKQTASGSDDVSEVTTSWTAQIAALSSQGRSSC